MDLQKQKMLFKSLHSFTLQIPAKRSNHSVVTYCIKEDRRRTSLQGVMGRTIDVGKTEQHRYIT